VSFCVKYQLPKQITFLQSITIESDRVLGRVTEKGLGQPQPEDGLSVKDPDGHTFYVKGGQTERPMTMVAINVQNLHDSKGENTQFHAIKLFALLFRFLGASARHGSGE
jgi:hypothetical protein